MSMSYYTCIGAYIEVPQKIKEVEKQHNSCLNGECSSYGKKLDSKFCGSCGKETGLFKWKEQSEVRIQHALYESGRFEDDLYTPGYGCKDLRIAVSNTHNCNLSINNHEEGVLVINQAAIDECIQKFKEAHQEDIAALSEYYGQELEVKFGAYTYWS